MGCRDIREIISSYVDGEARPEEARMVEEHLGGCPQCRQAEKRMRDLGIAVARAEGAAPPDFREKLFSVLGSFEDWERIATAGYEHVRARHSITARSEDFEKALEAHLSLTR